MTTCPHSPAIPCAPSHAHARPPALAPAPARTTTPPPTPVPRITPKATRASRAAPYVASASAKQLASLANATGLSAPAGGPRWRAASRSAREGLPLRHVLFEFLTRATSDR